MTEDQIAYSDNSANLAISLIDLTSLTNEESEQDIILLCKQAKSIAGNTAAICIFPQFIATAKQQLIHQQTPDIKIATVVNFPKGNSDIQTVMQETNDAIILGADEIDLVFPYQALINGNSDIGFDVVHACKKVCGTNTLLKVIIESGELKQPRLIKQASEIAIAAGADFIKTSTGKVAINATLAAAEIMLKVIYQQNANVGFKAAGGVKTLADASQYLSLAMDILGASWLNASHFRFGASSLLTHLLASLDSASTHDNSPDKIGY